MAFRALKRRMPAFQAERALLVRFSREERRLEMFLVVTGGTVRAGGA
jgi:hypothetical protein